MTNSELAAQHFAQLARANGCVWFLDGTAKFGTT